MRRLSIISAALVMTAACASQKAALPLSEKVVLSEMSRAGDATWLDGQGGNLKWNYTTGLELKAILDVYDTYGGEELLGYVDAWYDRIISEDGTIYKYKLSNYSTDHVCPARTLFRLYEITSKEKYLKAIRTIRLQLESQPRTPEGGFWHKQVYPDQMWLDGLYMAQPFYAEYTARYEDPALRDKYFRDIMHQFTLIAEHTWDPTSRLYRHAWDSSRKMFWCSPVTGQSEHAWGRALGWYCMAIVDVLPMIPEGTEGRDEVIGILRGIFKELPRFADPETGMWYQVLDRPGAKGNYVEATASAMFTYAMLKGIRLGYLDPSLRPYALKTYKSLLSTFVREDEGGLVNLDRCCEVAGLGGKDNRSGDYNYYINEKVRSNDPKGIGPLVWAALEYEML